MTEQTELVLTMNREAEIKMDKITIEKGSAAESMMLPLYARAFCDRYFPRTFPNPEAAELMGRLDYDFSAIENAYGPAQMSAFAVKVRILSELVRGYLRQHPGALLINLGCGADLTFGLVDNGSCRGLNIDLPQVIEARQRLIACRDREENLAFDMFDYGWMDRADAAEGICILCGSVLQFCPRDRVTELIAAMAERFPGGTLCFDYVTESAALQANHQLLQAAGDRPVPDGKLMDFALSSPVSELEAVCPNITGVTDIQKVPAYINKSKELPRSAKFIYTAAFRKGTLRFAEVRF